MSRVGVIAAIVVAALAILAIQLAGTGSQPAGSATSGGDETTKAYDYEVRDVKVQQMGPDGTLQYELVAKQITQQPDNGQISAEDLVMHHDPAGTAPDSANRWTLTANRADLPESGTAITLQGKVQARGRPQNSQAMVALETEQLPYALKTQDVSTRKPVDVTWGSSSFHLDDVRMNIKRGTLSVESQSNGTFAP